MRFRRLACGLGIGVSLSACFGCGRDEQRLDAEAIVVDAEGAPLAGTGVDAYVVYFRVADGIEIERRFVEDVTEPDGIRTDGGGRFQVAGQDLELSYDWQQEEYVCEDVCADWGVSCAMVTDVVCVEHCEEVTYDECWDECWDDCETVCQDDVVCDEDGNCWTETTCEDVCTTSCEPVCGPVTENVCQDECWEETYEQCDDVCLETVQQCGWVTHTYTSYPALSEVVSARAELFLRDAEGLEHMVPGETLESRQGQQCSGERCNPVNLWLQRDRFVVPFAP
jgi:hypothetical protein